MSIPILSILGQSNAAGRGIVESITNFLALGYHLPVDGVTLMDRVEDSATDPLVWDISRGPIDLQPMPGGNYGAHGIELSLGRELLELGLGEHGIAKMAIGGISLGAHWLPTGVYPATPPNLFNQALTFLGDAETAMDGYIAALIWIQGEADANNGGQAVAYAANFAAFATAFRVAFPATPIIYNRLHSGAGGAFNSTVRAQQANMSENIAKMRMFDVDDLALIGAHFDSNAFVTLGERFAPHVMKSLALTPRVVSMSVGITL